MFLQFGFFCDQPLGVFRREICIGVSEQGLGGGDEFGIISARAYSFAKVGRRGHGVDIGIVGETGMRVVIEGWNLVDLWKQTLVNLLDIGTGKRTRLSVGKNCCKGRDAEQKTGQYSRSQFHISLRG